MRIVIAEDAVLLRAGLTHLLVDAGAVDATIVRVVLVPATMELLGEANWWLPRWLRRILPKVNLDGHHEPVEEREPVLTSAR